MGMEKIGLECVIDWFYNNDFEIGIIVIDCYLQIQKWIRENLFDIIYYYDVWYVVKGMFILKKERQLG